MRFNPIFEVFKCITVIRYLNKRLGKANFYSNIFINDVNFSTLSVIIFIFLLSLEYNDVDTMTLCLNYMFSKNLLRIFGKIFFAFFRLLFLQVANEIVYLQLCGKYHFRASKRKWQVAFSEERAFSYFEARYYRETSTFSERFDTTVDVEWYMTIINKFMNNAWF